jgi:RHS repeat-associated protein
VNFDPNDKSVIRTVIAVDGLGKALVTAKDGAKWDGNRDLSGWNVAGPASLDDKGRAVAQGQAVFLEEEKIEAVVNFRHPEQDGEFGLRYPTLTEYDSQDRPVLVVLPDGSRQRTQYAIRNERSIVTVTDPLGNKSEQESDARGNIVEVRRFGRDGNMLAHASYEYNAIGEMLKAVDSNGNVLGIEYDLMGRRTALWSPDIGRKEYAFDRWGNLIRETDSVLRAQGAEIRYEYDDMNRLVKIKYPKSKATEYEYGKDGAAEGRANRIAKLTDESGQTEYAYGALGETVREARGITRLDPSRGGARETRVMEYRSNYLGQMESVTYDDGEEVQYKYNRGGQVKMVTGKKPGNADFTYVSEIGYDEFGQRVYIKYGNDPYGNGNGVETWYKYDPARRWLTNIVTKNPRGNVTYQDISYELDAVGNVKGYSNNGDMHMTGQRYEYDDLYQLVEARGESIGHPGTGLPAYNSTYQQTFAFDSIGNMTNKTSNSLYSTVQPPGVNLNYKLQYEYLPGTHKASRIGDMYYGYDGNGNLVTEQAGSPAAAASNTMRVSEEGGVYSTEYGFALRSREGGEAETGTTAYRRDYIWNERNLLQRSADRQYQVEYRYGADGQRAVKFAQGGGVATETRYFNQMLHTSSGVTGELVSKHIYVGETRIVTKRRQAGNENYGQEYKSQYFYHGDHLGSAQLVTDSEGKVYEHLEYTPYGELWVDRSTAATGNSPTPFRFTGKEFDPETGLYYYGARYLDPKTSRWISADPALGEYVPQAPINDEAKRYNKNLPGMGGIFNTVNLHVYHYAGNNPVKLTDPDGRDINDVLDSIGKTTNIINNASDIHSDLNNPEAMTMEGLYKINQKAGVIMNDTLNDINGIINNFFKSPIEHIILVPLTLGLVKLNGVLGQIGIDIFTLSYSFGTTVYLGNKEIMDTSFKISFSETNVSLRNENVINFNINSNSRMKLNIGLGLNIPYTKRNLTFEDVSCKTGFVIYMKPLSR